MSEAKHKDLNWLFAQPIAHRGLHVAENGIVENSVSAAIAAINNHFAIECDVQLTRDGEAVVFHDFELNRLTKQTGDIDQHTAYALSQISLKNSRDTIVTLQQFIQLIAGQVPLIIEIKSRFDNDLRLTRRVADIVNGLELPIAVKSFDPACIAELRRVAPHIPRGIVAMNNYDDDEFAHLTPDNKQALANLLHYKQTKPDFLSWKISDLLSATSYLASNGLQLPLMTWTVRTQEQRSFAQAHADQMIFEGFIP